jgi:hypothetical protein
MTFHHIEYQLYLLKTEQDIYQDNMSALSLEKKGSISSSKHKAKSNQGFLQHMKDRHMLLSLLMSCVLTFSQHGCNDRNSGTCVHSYKIVLRTTMTTLNYNYKLTN